jgi:hypothetical protein
MYIQISVQLLLGFFFGPQREHTGNSTYRSHIVELHYDISMTQQKRNSDYLP